ncbi:MAG: Gfo/Idh/MocA family oxidoreductase [Pseudomonadota bacterium]
MQPTKIGILGCGVIADAYLTGAARSELVSVAGIADIRPQAAEEKAAAHGVNATTIDKLFADDDISIIVNLTVPEAHAGTNAAILHAGKHVYTEKPLAVSFTEAQRTIELGEAVGLRVGCAPDTFFGAGHQNVRALIDEGRIGSVTGGSAVFANPGPEPWHPNPFFFYKRGGGPVLDIGCYPITQLVNCLGPVESVVAHASCPRRIRTVGSGPNAGAEITVEVFTTLNGALAFENGANVSFTASWDVLRHTRPPIEFYGTEGTILNPDPNFFGGPVLVSEAGQDFKEVSISGQPFGAPTRTSRDGRGIADYRMVGVFDMACAIANNRPHRADGALALHVLEVMEGLERAALEGRRVVMATRCQRPAPVPKGEGEVVFLAN